MQSSKTDDLFGAAMNKCTKINSKAPLNAIIIGEELFKIITPFEDKYSFITIDESILGIEGKYLTFLYFVTSKDDRKTLNPFNKKLILLTRSREQISTGSFRVMTMASMPDIFSCRD